MRIYYHGAYQRPDVLVSAPLEASEQQANAIFARLHEPRACLGIELGDGRTLQLYYEEEGAWHAEVLTEKTLATRSCRLNTPLAELLIEAAFRGEDFEQKIAFAAVTWKDEPLTPNA